MYDFYDCVFWVGFCIFIIYYLFTVKAFILALRFLVHMKSARFKKKSFNATNAVNTGRVVLASSYSNCVYIIWSYGISVLITNLDLMTLLAEKTSSLIQWLLSNSDKSDLCPTHSAIDKFAHLWTIISSKEIASLMLIEQGTRERSRFI